MFSKGRAFVILCTLLLLAPLAVAQTSPVLERYPVELANIAFKNATGQDLTFYATVRPGSLDKNFELPGPVEVEVPEAGNQSMNATSANGATGALELSASGATAGMNISNVMLGRSAAAIMPRRAGAPVIFEELETVRADLGL